MLHSLTRFMIAVQLGITDLADRVGPHVHRERGQSTAEYALLLVGVGALAIFIFSWLKGSGLFEKLFSMVIGKILPH